MSMAQSLPIFSTTLPPTAHHPCPACSCPLSHSQSHLHQPPSTPPSSGTTNHCTMNAEDSGTISTGSFVPQSTLPQAPSSPSPSPSPAPESSPATAPAPNQLPIAAPPVDSAPHPASDLPSSSSNPNPNGPLKLSHPKTYKSMLQEYAQRYALPLPKYRTHNEGPPHAPQFRSSVTVDGRMYTSVNTFSQRKAAEQDAARIGLEGTVKNVKEEASPIIGKILWQDTVFCKSILNEFAAKMNMSRPTYNTVRPQGFFVSSLVLNGTTYNGDQGKNKKEAERLAARNAILSLMGDTGFETVLSDIIKSKAKLFDALHKANDLNHAHNAPAIEGVNENAGTDSGISHTQDQVIEPYMSAVVPQISAIQNYFMPVVSQQVSEIQAASVSAPSQQVSAIQAVSVSTPSQQVSAIQAASVPTPSQQVSAIPQAHTTPHPPHHEFKVPKQEITPMAITPPAEFVPPVQLPFITFVPQAQQQLTGPGPNLGKRKNRKNKKANKKVRAG